MTASTIATSGCNYRADGTGARFIDNSAADAGNSYQIHNGSSLELAAQPFALSRLSVIIGTGMFALANPGPSNAVPTWGHAIKRGPRAIYSR